MLAFPPPTFFGVPVLKKIALVLGLVLAAVLIAASFQPDSFRVERSATYNAKPAAIQAQIADLKAWQAWSPWEKLDPGMKREHSGASKGVGAKYAWEGNAKIGAGNMEVLEVTPSKVLIALNFTKPFEASNSAEFILAPEGAGTKLTWAMYGPSNYVSKLMGMVFSMDKMVGKSFEEGLESLRGIVEKK